MEMVKKNKNSNEFRLKGYISMQGSVSFMLNYWIRLDVWFAKQLVSITVLKLNPSNQ